MIELWFIDGDSTFEYFCKDCKQIRLSIKGNRDFGGCGNCGSDNVIIGAPNSLNKEDLQRRYGKPREYDKDGSRERRRDKDA